MPEGLDPTAQPVEGQSSEQDEAQVNDDAPVVPKERFDGLMARLQREIAENAGLKAQLDAQTAQPPAPAPAATGDETEASPPQDSDTNAALRAEVTALREELADLRAATRPPIAPTSPRRPDMEMGRGSETRRLKQHLDREFDAIMRQWRSS